MTVALLDNLRKEYIKEDKEHYFANCTYKNLNEQDLIENLSRMNDQNVKGLSKVRDQEKLSYRKPS